MKRIFVSDQSPLHPDFPVGVRLHDNFIVSLTSFFMSIKVRDAKWQKMAASQKPEQFVEFAQRYHVTLEPDEHYIWWQDQRINIHTREYREICQKVFLTLLKCPRVLTHLEKLEDNVIVMDEKAFPENLHCINHKVYSVWLNYIKNRYRHARKNYTFQTELMLDLLSA